MLCDVALSPALARAISISSCVRFFDSRNCLRLSRGEAATEGSWRTAQSVSRGHKGVDLLRSSQYLHVTWMVSRLHMPFAEELTAEFMSSSRAIARCSLLLL